MQKFFSLMAAAAVVASVSAPSMAQDSPVSANIALTTKYKYRGQDQSDPAKNVLPAVQGGFDYSNGGFYLGNWNSSVGFDNGTEMDFYGGYRAGFGDFSYDVGLLNYYYPGVSALNTTELYGSVGFGPVSAKYSHTVSKKYFGIEGARGTGYIELNAGFEVASGIKLVGHLGTTQFSSDAKSNGAVNYVDYKVGADFDVGGGFTLGLAFAGANKKNAYGDLNKGRAIATLSKAL